MKRINVLPPHEFWMQRAFHLARLGEGLTRPNPPVGAVAVKNGKIVGEGYHRKAGGRHAEVMALTKAGNNAKGCTLYVTLEPCCTWGRTPPCTDLILSAGVQRVVVSVRDPNPRHSGRGLALLRRHGIPVLEGICASEGRSLTAPFAKWARQKMPYVTLKLGMSIDGKIADRNGKSKWITGRESRNKVQELRRRVDAIFVGAETVRVDNPSLLPRPDHGRKPWRIVVSREGRIPCHSQLLTDGAVKQTIIVVSTRCPTRSVKQLEKTGAEILAVPETQGQLSPRTLCRQLARRGILHILCEGGAELAESLIRANLVDEYLFFVSPCVIGGTLSRGAIGGRGWLLGSQPSLTFVSCERAGRDLMIQAMPA